MAELRQRKGQVSNPEGSPAKAAPPAAKAASSRLGLLLGLGALSLAAVGIFKPEILPAPLSGLFMNANEVVLTEKQLLAYTGKDPDKPIYLAIEGVIYDVSASPRFYGPGGHYNHFTGRDASRGWVTECWDTPDQLVHNIEGAEAMYMPRYMDEELQNYLATGKIDEYVKERQGLEPLLPRAKEILEIVGPVDQEEIDRRRAEDIVEAKAAVQARLDHWTGFFAENEKYKTVGRVILSPPKRNGPPPPEPCEAAYIRGRKMKGGKVEEAGAKLAQEMAKKAGVTPEELAAEAMKQAKSP